MTTPLQKAAQALLNSWDSPRLFTDSEFEELRKALDAELAQSVEPVAWTTRRFDDIMSRERYAEHKRLDTYTHRRGDFDTPLYLHPPQPQAMTPAVPEGYVLVPIEPTDAMIKAADDGDKEYSLRSFGPTIIVQQGAYDHYCAMIRAAQGEKP